MRAASGREMPKEGSCAIRKMLRALCRATEEYE